MRAGSPNDQETPFWTSVMHGFPLLCLTVSDFITLTKPAKDGSGTFLDADVYRIVIFGGIYLLSAWVVYLRRADFWELMRGHWIYILFLLYAFSSFIWSANPGKVVLGGSHLFGHYLVATAGLLMFRGNEVSLLRVYCMFSYIFVPACLVVVLFFPDRNAHFTGRWMGLTLNPNTLGGAAMICIWANLSYLLYSKKFLMRLLIVSTIAGAFVLTIGTGSVTSLTLSLFVFLGVPLFYWFAGSRDVVMAGIKMFYTALVLFSIGGYLYATQPELFNMDRMLGAVGRDANLTGRTTLWAIGNAAIQERPWLGWSFDALQSLPTKFSISYKQFHNGYIDIWVRGGLVALGFIAIFTITTAFRLVRLAPINKKLAASFAVLLIAILANNASESSLGTAPHPLWLLFTFLYIGVSSRILKWHETGVLEEVKILNWRRTSKRAPGDTQGLPSAVDNKTAGSHRQLRI